MFPAHAHRATSSSLPSAVSTVFHPLNRILHTAISQGSLSQTALHTPGHLHPRSALFGSAHSGHAVYGSSFAHGQGMAPGGGCSAPRRDRSTSRFNVSGMATFTFNSLEVNEHRRALCGFQSRGFAVNITFHTANGGDTWKVPASIGQTIMDAAIDHDVNMEGACGGQCACSTCHVILTKEQFDSLPEPDEDELDMLDLAMDVQDTSRLSCQIKVEDRMEGWKISLPEGTKNFFN